ncbi:MAG TPA: hypothetical protein VLV54_02660 [Thermoanaerobaculia bacterium]|nr:hypothetical protein [Thermoanaerobaculia bacterium]
MNEMAPKWRRILIWTAIAGLYTALTLVSLRPIWRIGGDHLTNSLSDPLFNLWVLKWGVHQIGLGLPDVWNANIFYPTRGTLALSDHLLGPAAQLALFLKILPNAIAGYNFLLFTSFVASALATCWVARRGGMSWAAAVLAGWMFAFSPFRFSQIAHLQILIAQWIPLTLWFWDRLLAERTAKNAALFLVFYLLNLTGGCYLAYMIHFPLLALLASRVVAERRALVSARALRLLIPVAVVAAGAVAVIFLPYLRVSQSLGLVRTEAETHQMGATPASYFSPAPQNVYFTAETRDWMRSLLGEDRAKAFLRPEGALFAGFLPSGLFVFLLCQVAVRACRRPSSPRPSSPAPSQPPTPGEEGDQQDDLHSLPPLPVWGVGRGRERGLGGEGPPQRGAALTTWDRGLAISGLCCFALSFSWVYEPLMRVIPGLSGMRVPARFYVFTSLTLVWFAARGVDGLLRRIAKPRARLALAAVFALILAVELTPRPLRWVPLPREEEIPDAYRWIGREPSVKALVELPIHRNPDENEYLYNSTVHWKPIANGYSGYLPASHEALVNRIHFLPEQDGLDLLREDWITHLVVHASNPIREERLRGWDRRFANGPQRQVERVYQSGEISIYRLLAAPTSSKIPNRSGR